MPEFSLRWVFPIVVFCAAASMPIADERSASLAVPAEQPVHDQLGDPLPRGATARLGTVRFRHGASIHFVGFSQDGERLVAEDGYGKAVLWNVTTGEELGQIEGGLYAFFPNGKALRLSGGSHRIGVLDLATGKVVGQFHDQEEGDRLLNFSPNGRAVASVIDDKSLRLWDAATGRCLHQLRGHQARICGIAFSGDGRTLASTDCEGTIRIWDVARGIERSRITNADDCSGSVLVFSPDGKILASAWDGKIGLWSTASGRGILKLPGHQNHVAGMAFTPDGSMLVSGGWGDKTVRVWEVATGRITREFGGLGGCMETIALSPDGKTVATGGDDDTIRLWDLKSGKERVLAAGHQGIVLASGFSPDGSVLISGGRDARIAIWGAGKERGAFRVPDVQVYAAAIAPDGRTVATAGMYDDHTVRIVDVVAAKEVARLEHQGPVTCLAFAPDGKTLASGVGANGVCLWELAGCRRLRSLPGHEHKLRREAYGTLCLAFSPDGRFLASGGTDDTIMVWKVVSGEERYRLAGHASHIVSLAFSPDGRMLASGAQDDEIRLWEMATGKECGRMAAHFFGARCLAFSRDGKILASGGYDKLIHLWSVVTGHGDWQLAGHIGPISTLAFSPDGKTLASGSEDTTILLWDGYGSFLKDQPSAIRLTPFDLRNRWRDLRSPDAADAYQSLGRLFGAGNQAVHFLREQLQPAPAVDARHIAQLVAELDHSRFDVREKSSYELKKLGELAEPALRAALIHPVSLEVRRRAEGLLRGLEGPVADPDRLQAIRGVAVLEHIASPEARDLLTMLAQGARQALLTREAKQALDRLNRLPPRK